MKAIIILFSMVFVSMSFASEYCNRATYRGFINKKHNRVCNFRLTNLVDINLSGANLPFADFRGANLSFADLSDADLRYADFRGADLRYVDFTGADLTGANFSGVLSYSPVYFNKTKLSGADFSYSYLLKAEFTDAIIKSTVNYFQANVCGEWPFVPYHPENWYGNQDYAFIQNCSYTPQPPYNPNTPPQHCLDAGYTELQTDTIVDFSGDDPPGPLYKKIKNKVDFRNYLQCHKSPESIRIIRPLYTWADPFMSKAHPVDIFTEKPYDVSSGTHVGQDIFVMLGLSTNKDDWTCEKSGNWKFGHLDIQVEADDGFSYGCP